ncbi:calcium-binding protein, partial [Bradyrhizobium iriomotense]|uniref:calcium-binding protein n=1 Tax=Bradyrhizobium iriomotense TaxID=441950 RepID=UPI0024E07FB8
VMSSVSYTLSDYVENLTLTGSAAINGTGNSEANIIIGNDAANIITGGLGNDILTGGAGADTFVINSGDGSDIITDFTPGSAAGHDIVQLNGFAFTSFNDIKAAMTQVGNDVYLALTSQDTLVFRNTTISAFTSDDFQLPSTLPVGGTITSWISGSTSSHIVYGTAANDQITAVNADDTLVGWTGDDTYVIGNPNQKIIENPGGGIDSVQAWSSYTLPANVENLTLMTGGLTGVGNELANRMVGSSGDDILNGAGGDDWLSGGTGNDTFIYSVGSGHDTIADFHVLTSATAEHDKLVLKGYDASAYLTNVGNEWTIHYAGGTDSFRIVGVTHLSSSDYAFVSGTGASMTMAGPIAPTNSVQFACALYGLSGNGDPSSSDILDLKDISLGSGTKVAYSGGTSGRLLTVSDVQNHTARIKPVGDHPHSTFNRSSDGSERTLVIDPSVDQFKFSPAKASTPTSTLIRAAAVAGDAFIFAGTATTGSAQPLISTDHAQDQALFTANHIGTTFDHALAQGMPYIESHIHPTDLHGYLLHA